LDEAEKLADGLTDPLALKTLLGACRKFNDLERAERVANRILSIDPKDTSVYVLLSNIYASFKRFEDVKRVRQQMRDVGIRENA